MHLRRVTVLMAISLASLPFILGGSCAGHYRTFAETRRQFISLSWLLGDWTHLSQGNEHEIHWVNSAADTYTGEFPCLPRFKHIPKETSSEADWCKYQITRVNGNICIDTITSEPALGLRYFLQIPSSQRNLRFDDRIDSLQNVFQIEFLASDTFALTRHLSLAGDSVIDTFVRVAK